jgi:hypothetical protein
MERRSGFAGGEIEMRERKGKIIDGCYGLDIIADHKFQIWL